jgi:hypothetical protein
MSSSQDPRWSALDPKPATEQLATDTKTNKALAIAADHHTPFVAGTGESGNWLDGIIDSVGEACVIM